MIRLSRYLEAVVDIPDAALCDGRARQRHVPTATVLTTRTDTQKTRIYTDRSGND